MSKQVRYLRQVVSHLEEKYGSEKAQAVMTKAQKRYDELVEENGDEPKLLSSRLNESSIFTLNETA